MVEEGRKDVAFIEKLNILTKQNNYSKKEMD